MTRGMWMLKKPGNWRLKEASNTEALNAWGRTQKLGKRIELCTRVKQRQAEPFIDIYKGLLRLYK